VLLQIANRIALRDVDVTAIKTFLPENHLEKGRFAATVATYKTDAFMVGNKHASAIQKDLHAKRLRYILNLNHETKDRFLKGRT